MAEAIGVAAAPAEVRSSHALIDLFPGYFAHVVDENRTGAGLHRECVRVAQPEYVDQLVDAGRRADERIVVRDQMADGGVVARGDAAVELRHVDAQLLAEQGAERLRHAVGVAVGGQECLHVVAGIGVELAVETEMNCAAIVVGGAGEVVPVEDRALRS